MTPSCLLRCWRTALTRIRPSGVRHECGGIVHSVVGRAVTRLPAQLRGGDSAEGLRDKGGPPGNHIGDSDMDAVPTEALGVSLLSHSEQCFIADCGYVVRAVVEVKPRDGPRYTGRLVTEFEKIDGTGVSSAGSTASRRSG